MTIYAIVNNLISPATKDPMWTLISSNSILQGGNPYFVPDFAGRFEIRPALSIRIGKLGKGIPARFAYRYISGVAPCLVMAAADKLESLREAGMPWTQALSYDRSVAFGRYADIPADKIRDCSVDVTLQTGEKTDRIIMTADTMIPAEETIAALSRDNTLKTGDLIIAGVAAAGPEAHPATKVTLSLNGEVSLRFNIR